MDEQIRQAALEYHRLPKPGKISIAPTKALTNQQDLSMAYSPGVAAACDAIVEDPAEAATLTSRSNLIGVVTTTIKRDGAPASVIAAALASFRVGRHRAGPVGTGPHGRERR